MTVRPFLSFMFLFRPRVPHPSRVCPVPQVRIRSLDAKLGVRPGTGPSRVVGVESGTMHTASPCLNRLAGLPRTSSWAKLCRPSGAGLRMRLWFWTPARVPGCTAADLNLCPVNSLQGTSQRRSVKSDLEAIEKPFHAEQSGDRQIRRKTCADRYDSSRRVETNVMRIDRGGAGDSQGLQRKAFFDVQPNRSANVCVKYAIARSRIDDRFKSL